MAEPAPQGANLAPILVRPVRCEERARWRHLMNAHHYLGFRPIVGQLLDLNRLPLDGHGGLMEMLRTLVDPRKPQGVRHPLVTVVAISVGAALTGTRSFKAIAEWAKDLTRETLRRLGSQRWRPPSEPTIRRVLQKLDADRLDVEIGRWLLPIVAWPVRA